MTREAADWGPDEIVIPSAGLVRVGRGSQADIELRHPTVAEPHAVLSRTVGGLQIRDRTRGRTLVNGRPVRDVAMLREGDRVDFGAVSFHVREGKLHRDNRQPGLAITAEGLGVERDAVSVLAGVRLEIRPGEFVGLLGPSGAGKSTLLKCLAGFLMPTPGSRLRADELEIPAQVASYRALIGYVPQEDVIFPGLSVAANLDYGLRLRNPDLGRTERRGLIRAVLGQLDVADLSARPASSISPGQRKRVCVAQELMTRPRALFLDEPTSGLDPAQETRLMQVFRGLAAQGMTVVCATHVLENLLLFDRVVAVVRGRVAYDGPPGEILERFGALNYPDLYVKLEASRPSAEPASPRPALRRSIPPAAPDPHRPIGLRQEVTVQVARGAALIRSDPMLLALLVGLPLGIGALIDLSQVDNVEASTVVTFAAVTAVWLGLNNTAREVVRDRGSYLREQVLGVTPSGYLASKVVLFGTIGLAQVALLCLMLRLGALLDDNLARNFRPISTIPLVATLWVTYLGGLLLGLLISARADTEEWAVAMVPLVVLPQLLLTGAATQMTGKGRFHSIAHLVSTAGQTRRSFAEWAVEVLSIPLYTRPAVSILKKRFVPDGVEASATLSEGLVRSIDVAHLGLLVALTGVAAVWMFRSREPRWLSKV